MDTLARRTSNDVFAYPAEQRIIGLELRYLNPANGFQEEVALIPCDVRLPLSSPTGFNTAYQRGEINCTIHTSHGDTNFPVNAQLPA